MIDTKIYFSEWQLENIEEIKSSCLEIQVITRLEPFLFIVKTGLQITGTLLIFMLVITFFGRYLSEN